jgi:hypothetical protein
LTISLWLTVFQNTFRSFSLSLFFLLHVIALISSTFRSIFSLEDKRRKNSLCSAHQTPFLKSNKEKNTYDDKCCTFIPPFILHILILLTLKSRNQMLWRRVHVEAELFNKVQKTRFTPPSYACFFFNLPNNQIITRNNKKKGKNERFQLGVLQRLHKRRFIFIDSEKHDNRSPNKPIRITLKLDP